MNQFLYWYRDDKKRALQKDIEWAINRFRLRHKIEPQELLVNPDELEDYQKLDLTLNLVENNSIRNNYFGLR